MAVGKTQSNTIALSTIQPHGHLGNGVVALNQHHSPFLICFDMFYISVASLTSSTSTCGDSRTDLHSKDTSFELSIFLEWR